MKEMPLYKILRTVQMQKGCTLACVLDGDAAEEQLLLCDGEPVWQTGNSEFLLQNIRSLQDVTATGMLKMGNTQVFAERFGAVPQLIICGGGHVAASVARLAKLLGLPVLAMDDRKEYADSLSEAGADKVICQPFVQALEQVDGSAETYFIVATRAHAFDVACLKEILKKPAAYVGMMGSKGRSALVRRQLLEQGTDARRVEISGRRPRDSGQLCWMRWNRQMPPGRELCLPQSSHAMVLPRVRWEPRCWCSPAEKPSAVSAEASWSTERFLRRRKC